MTTETRAAFARRLGINKSTVTRWADTGRIVLDGDRVDVEASLRRIEETGGARPDVAERHAAARGVKVGGGDTAPAPPQAAPEDRIGNSYQAARAVKEKYGALKAKADYEEQIGNLIAREDVDAAMRAIGAAVRAALDVMPDQVAPIIAPPTDIDDAHAMLAEAARTVLNAIGESMARAKTEMARGGAA